MTRNIKKYDFKEGLPQEFEILDLESLYKNASEILTSIHRTNFYHIIWFQEGTSEHFVDFNSIKIQENTLLFLNKNIVHRFDNKNFCEGKIIIFTDDFFCRTQNDIKYLENNILFNDLFNISKIYLQKNVISLFEKFLSLMINELKKEKDIYQSDILHHYLYNFLLYSEREKNPQNLTEIKKSLDLDYVMNFKKNLEKNFKIIKQVNKYAEQINITEKRLNQAITKVLGKTPKEFIDQRITLEAKRLLAHTNKNIKEIAYELGFEEPTNFIKYFKKHTKITPKKFKTNLNLA